MIGHVARPVPSIALFQRGAALGTVVVPIPQAVPLRPETFALFAAVALLVAFGTTRKPSFGIAALLIIEPFAVARVLGATTATLPKAALVGFLLGLALRRTSLAPLRAPVIRALVGGAAALVIVDALSILPATYLDAAGRETLKALEYFVAFLAAAIAYAADPDETLIWNALAVVSVLVCVLALVQEVTVAPSGFFLHGRIVPRIAGPLDGPNQLAGWLDLATPLLAARALFAGARLKPPSSASASSVGHAASPVVHAASSVRHAASFAGRSTSIANHAAPSILRAVSFTARAPLFSGLATLAVTTDLLTLSRSGIAAIVVGLAVVFVLAARAGHARRLLYALPLAIIPVVAVAALLTFANARGGVAEFAARFGDASEQNVENGLATRPVLWQAGLRMFASDPGLGVGAGNYELLTPTVGLVGVRTHANSVYAQALAETGVLGFAAVVWTFVAAAATMLRCAREPLFAGIAAATITLAVHETYDFLTFYPKVGDLWWLLLGIGAGAAVLRNRAARDHGVPETTRLAAGSIAAQPIATSPP